MAQVLRNKDSKGHFSVDFGTLLPFPASVGEESTPLLPFTTSVVEESTTLLPFPVGALCTTNTKSVGSTLP